MGMLEKAKGSSKSDDAAEGDSKDTGDKKAPEHKKKKAKHPASSVAQQPQDGEGEEADEGGADAQPSAQPDQSEQEDTDAGGDAGPAPQQSQDQDGGQGQDDADASGGDQPAQQGGPQGASPVPSPAAPGAGDTTSGGNDTPDADGDQDGDQDPNAQPPQTPGEDTAAGPGSESSLPQIPMSPGLEDEYKRANDMLMQLLYKSADDKLASGILQGAMPQGPAKVKNAAMTAITVVTQIHKKMNLPPQIILPFAKDVVAHVMDLGMQVKQIQYSDQESTAILGSVYEAMLRIFGVSKGAVKLYAQHLGRKTLSAQQQKYQQAHAHAKPAMDANNAAFHHDELNTQQGAPQTAGPQTGAPAGAQSATTSGAPPQQPVPQQGMLSAAAQQSPEGESNG